MSITLEAASVEELVQRLEKTLKILGRRVGAPAIIGEWTFQDVAKLMEYYEQIADAKAEDLLRKMTGADLLSNCPINWFPAFVAALYDGMDDKIIERSMVR